MSDPANRRRIRAQGSAADAQVMGFILEQTVQDGASARYDAAGDSPLSRALFALPGVTRVEVNGATIWVRRDETADWDSLKPAVAAAIRDVLDGPDAPLGPDETDRETALLAKVEALLDRQVNPSVASHGGHISVDRVEGGTVFLRMSGGCQGCAASSATLRQGVERMLRAALPEIGEIVDVTDHQSGRNPYYAHDRGASPTMHRPVPDGVITREDGQITVDPDFLAPRLGLTPESLRSGLRNGDVVGVTETGEGADVGKTRVVLRSAGRSWAAEIDANGAAREIPPPRLIAAATGREQALAGRVRAHLEALPEDRVPITYGALARALGLWMPGSVARVTGALETTMREDAAAGRPFIAARVVRRGPETLPARGFFELADALSCGPRNGETERDFHEGELRRLASMMSGRSAETPATE